MSDFDEYIRQGEPNQKAKVEMWRTAIGLQIVDGLQTSNYLKDTSCKFRLVNNRKIKKTLFPRFFWKILCIVNIFVCSNISYSKLRNVW